MTERSLRVLRAGPEATGAIVSVGDASLPGAWSRASLAEELARPDARCWLAVAEDVIGHLVCRRVLDEVHVLQLAVAPAARRRGAARALLERAFAEEAEAGALRWQLEARAGAAPARRCYRAAGFSLVGRRPRYYPDGEDALLMTKESAAARRASA